MRSYGPTVLRFVVGAVFIAHGVEKLFGVRSASLSATTSALTRLHVPAAYPFAVAPAPGELACGVLLVAGAFALWATLALIAGHAVSVYAAYAGSGGLVPSGRVPRLEFEMAWLLSGALVALLLTGPGALSLDSRRTRT